MSVVIVPGLHIHFRGLFSSIPPHVAAAVTPPGGMSTHTRSEVPRGIILATLVLVFVTSMAVVPHVGVGRYDGHHKMSDCTGHVAAVVSMRKSLAQTNKSSAAACLLATSEY